MRWGATVTRTRLVVLWRLLIAVPLIGCMPTVSLSQDLAPQERSVGYEPIFNGTDLTGWDGDPELWKVAGGVIVGSTDGQPLKHNSFLISKGTYRDFELRFEVRLRNGNSGMQFRSERTGSWTLRGYQADFADGKGWGNLHGEGLPRGLILDGWQNKSEFVVRRTWNSVWIRCEGHRIQITVNGLLVNDVLDPGALSGLVGMQLHRGEAMRVEFRNLRILRLPSYPRP